MTITKAILAGYFNPTGQSASFLVPVYRAGTAYFFQEVGEGSVINLFSPAPDPLPGKLLKAEATTTKKIGDAAVFAFVFPDGSLVRGSKDLVRKRLHSRHHELLHHPFLALVVARFIDDAKLERKQVFKLGHQLELSNPQLGRDWLDRELHKLDPGIKRHKVEALVKVPGNHDLFSVIEDRLRTDRDVYVRVKLQKNPSGLTRNAKKLLSSLGLVKARAGNETPFMPVASGTLRNIKQLSGLTRVIDFIDLPKQESKNMQKKVRDKQLLLSSDYLSNKKK